MATLARDTDTICAIATPPGHGGIAVIRVSGPGAFQISSRLCPFLPARPESHKLYYGFAREFQSGEKIDEIVAAYFASGRSFTGEETLELSCHGSPMIASQLCQELIVAGCRAAGPGEFTYRAFMNGRLDLVQAESVLALIEAHSKAGSKIALRQLEGELSSRIEKLEDDLTWALAHLEANIDFSTENLEVVSSSELQEKLKDVLARLSELTESYQAGRLLKDGVKVALVGRTNVGKSSLLNALLGYDRSIVTAVEGTTRDVVEAPLRSSGIQINLVDTAGLRVTEDVVEKFGVERTFKAAAEADLVLLVLDATRPESWTLDESFHQAAQRPAAVVLNKVDLIANKQDLLMLGQKAQNLFKKQNLFLVSSANQEGLPDLKNFLHQQNTPAHFDQSAVITQARHFELLRRAHSCVLRALDLASSNASPELITFELQDSLYAVQEILGKQFDDEVLDRVFKEFCIGK